MYFIICEWTSRIWYIICYKNADWKVYRCTLLTNSRKICRCAFLNITLEKYVDALSWLKPRKHKHFRGFAVLFELMSDNRNYRLENCGARRAALRPYSPDLDPKRPVFMRFFGLSSLSKPIGKPTKSRNFWCSLTQPECSIHNAA